MRAREDRRRCRRGHQQQSPSPGTIVTRKSAVSRRVDLPEFSCDAWSPLGPGKTQKAVRAVLAGFPPPTASSPPQPKRRKPLSKPESRCQGQQRGGRERLATMFGIIVLASRRRPFCRPPPPDMLPFGFSNSSPLRARDRDNTAKVILKMNWAPAVECRALQCRSSSDDVCPQQVVSNPKNESEDPPGTSHKNESSSCRTLTSSAIERVLRPSAARSFGPLTECRMRQCRSLSYGEQAVGKPKNESKGQPHRLAVIAKMNVQVASQRNRKMNKGSCFRGLAGHTWDQLWSLPAASE
jgi:hypothetical protein